MTLNLYTSTSEEALIDGSRKNKAKAQKALFDKYSGKMLGVVTRYIKDKDESEEVMIASFMKVFEKIDQFKSEGSFEGWIRRIMVNESLMYLRKNNGLVRDVFQPPHMIELAGGNGNNNASASASARVGIGHVRYPTAGSSRQEEAQPFCTNYPLRTSC